MGADAYYKAERERVARLFPEFDAAKRPTFWDMETLIRRFAAEYNVRIARVRPTHGRRHSTWDPFGHVLTLNVDWAGWRTALHEMAHAIHDKLVGMQVARRRWHGAQHAEIMDDLCRVTIQRGWLTSIPAERAERAKKAAEEAERRAAAEAAKAADAARPENVRARKIAAREKQVAGLERKLRALAAREKALTTRLKRARRSLAALQRAAVPKEDEVAGP